MMKYKLRFQVAYDVEINLEEGQELADVVSNTNIPEDDETTYVADTFEVLSLYDDKGKAVDL